MVFSGSLRSSSKSTVAGKRRCSFGLMRFSSSFGSTAVSIVQNGINQKNAFSFFERRTFKFEKKVSEEIKTNQFSGKKKYKKRKSANSTTQLKNQMLWKDVTCYVMLRLNSVLSYRSK